MFWHSKSIRNLIVRIFANYISTLKIKAIPTIVLVILGFSQECLGIGSTQMEIDNKTCHCAILLQVNLFQKLSFLNQLTHNMTGDWLFIEFQEKKTSWQHIVYKTWFFVFVLTFKTIFVNIMLWTCILQGIQWSISCHIVG